MMKFMNSKAICPVLPDGLLDNHNLHEVLSLKINRLIISLFALVSSCLYSIDHYLTYPDVRKTMDEMFHLHVENKELSPLIVKRSIKLYIQQFDPDKIYLLKDEVQPYYELSNQRIQQIIDGYYNDDYSIFEQINKMIQGAIERHQQIRNRNKTLMLSSDENEYEEIYNKRFMNYSDSIVELKRRNYYHLLEVLKYHRNKRSLTNLTDQIKERIFLLWERKRSHFEGFYLSPHSSQKIDRHFLSLNILKSMSRSLDAHSGYYSPDEAYEIRANLKKQFHGIGVTLREDYDGIFISGIMRDGPADQTGEVKIGDRIVEIDGKSIETASFYEMLDHLKGEEGTSSVLGIVRDNEIEGLIHQVIIKREKIILHEERLSYTSEKYGKGIIGKIVMPGFYDNGENISLDRDLRDALKNLKKEGDLIGLVIDLRENSGGFLNQAVKVAGMFINSGVIVISKYSDGEMSYNRDVNGKEYFNGPVLLLTSKGSASAAEIITQSMQDYGVALVVGDDRTYGKGSMQYQTLTNPKATSFFKVTVGRYYTASGKSPQIDGVKVDIIVPTIFSPHNIGEKFLEFALSNDHLDLGVVSSIRSLKLKTHKSMTPPYVPYLQPRDTSWRKMLGQLKYNSKERLSADKNFNYFLKVIHGKVPAASGQISRSSIKMNNYGADDLQMKEAVNIVRDMIHIGVNNS